MRKSTAIALLFVVAGCAEVPAWDRGNLAQPHMAPDPFPAQRALLEHVYSSREGSTAGAAGQGGGCGCY
ncbi:MAG TPA: DUF4266 domain-containing protein [Burkholderiales bacterium]|nr:DUF4266 domain-containing protein [Burkholderiales bacterium]